MIEPIDIAFEPERNTHEKYHLSYDFFGDDR